VLANPKWQKAALFLNLVGTVILLMIIGLIVAIYTTSLRHPWDYFVPPLSRARIPSRATDREFFHSFQIPQSDEGSLQGARQFGGSLGLMNRCSGIHDQRVATHFPGNLQRLLPRVASA
jgi:hypothetical protein